MTATLTNFYSDKIGSTSTSIASTSSAQTAFIGQLCFTNTNSSAETVYVHKLTTGTTATIVTGGNWIAKKIIQPGKTWNAVDCLGAVVLGNSQTLSAQSTSANVVNCECAGAYEI